MMYYTRRGMFIKQRSEPGELAEAGKPTSQATIGEVCGGS